MSLDEKTVSEMTVEAADALFAEIARLEINSAEIAARYDDEISVLKREQTEALAPLQEALTSKIDVLSQYILFHTERFQKPRKRKTPHGTYGLTQSSKLQLDPKKEKALLEYADRMKLGLYTREIKMDKNAITEALKSGCKIPGACVITGNIAIYKVDMTYKEGGQA